MFITEQTHKTQEAFYSLKDSHREKHKKTPIKGVVTSSCNVKSVTKNFCDVKILLGVILALCMELGGPTMLYGSINTASVFLNKMKPEPTGSR